VTDEPAHGKPLAEADLGPNPLQAFAAWFAEAGEAGVRMPEAVALATATRAGAPSARMVLLKGFDDAGFVFYTNYESRKARELAENPQAALLFYWDEVGRQVRIDGAVEKVARAESEAYFASRPPGSQLSALASRQSEVIASRAKLETRVARLRDELAGADVPFPASWGGYRLAPVEYEFWQHREDRLHDRLRYRPAAAGGWLLERLQP
jgi:pyridoxamine 5'-phosphate oxidase